MTFRIGVSADFMLPNGLPAYPDWDMSVLDSDERIEWAFIPAEDGFVSAKDVKNIDALILLSARFDERSVAADGRLSLVTRFGVGYDNVDIEACTRAGVLVTITPDAVRRPVAVAILTQILALAGRIFDKERLARQGLRGWSKRSDYMGIGLEGLTLGSIGLGNIAGEMFRLARAFGFSFLAADPYADDEVASGLGVSLVDLDTLFMKSDFLAVNCPLTTETEGLVDARRFAQMKPSAFLINTARGPVVDQTALAAALRDKTIAGAALDVFADEPFDIDENILAVENTILTPHCLSWTDQCFNGIGSACVRATVDVMEGRSVKNAVNPSILKTQAWKQRMAKNARQFAG